MKQLGVGHKEPSLDGASSDGPQVGIRMPTGRGRVVLSNLTLPPTFIHSEVCSGGLICPGGRL